MSGDIIRMEKGKLVIGGKQLTMMQKGLVFLLIDVSESMSHFTSKVVSGLTIGHKRSEDGTLVRVIDPSSIPNPKTKLQAVMAGAGVFAERALATKKVGIVLFGSDAVLYHKATHDRSKLDAAISSIEHHALVNGSTNMTAAFDLLATGACPYVETVVVVTDGAPDDRASALVSANKLKEKATEILVIGTEDADWNFLAKVRSSPNLSVRVSNEGLQQAVVDASRLLR